MKLKDMKPVVNEEMASCLNRAIHERLDFNSKTRTGDAIKIAETVREAFKALFDD